MLNKSNKYHYYYYYYYYYYYKFNPASGIWSFYIHLFFSQIDHEKAWITGFNKFNKILLN